MIVGGIGGLPPKECVQEDLIEVFEKSGVLGG